MAVVAVMEMAVAFAAGATAKVIGFGFGGVTSSVDSDKPMTAAKLSPTRISSNEGSPRPQATVMRFSVLSSMAAVADTERLLNNSSLRISSSRKAYAVTLSVAPNSNFTTITKSPETKVGAVVEAMAEPPLKMAAQ